MSNKQELRSEQTKKDILRAARKHFTEKGFEAVTMREIAETAKCSHTTIYIYFKNKEALLQELSMPPLLELKQQMENILFQDADSPEDKLKNVSRAFIQFCLVNRNMYSILFMEKTVRVDKKDPKLEINKLRIELFALLKRGLKDCLGIGEDDDLLLAFSRIYFFTLNGIVGTYHHSEESAEGLMNRLAPTFDDAVQVLLYGFKEKMKTGR